MNPNYPIVQAERVFCYRWTCPTCKRINLSEEIVSGPSNPCRECRSKIKITRIACDNGAVLELVPSIRELGR
jgi:DNA-directed RNA polymerase subunit RPC12/RpoP